MSWCFADEATEYTDGCLRLAAESGLVVPSLWLYEVGNCIRTARRVGRMDADLAQEAVALLRSLRTEVDSESHELVWSTTLDLAVEQGLTVYDAAYVELAVRRSLPLATSDRAMLGVMDRVGAMRLVIG
ncbi:MAG: type II toxin-antitoxin system VapC family toxin [Fimbriimonadaceae bacterium]|nr:type II toxin-antitoxin system VapC family toxin [Fimbriimonadaceae bacterium]